MNNSQQKHRVLTKAGYDSLLAIVLCSSVVGAVNTPFTVDATGVHMIDLELQGSKVIFGNDFFDDIVDHTLFMGLGS